MNATPGGVANSRPRGRVPGAEWGEEPATGAAQTRSAELRPLDENWMLVPKQP